MSLDSPGSFPKITKLTEGPVIAGKPVVLACEIPMSNPLASISWRCNGFSIITVTTTPSSDKVISSVESIPTKDDNNNECTCVGNHPFWTGEKVMTYNLIVYCKYE